jgi:hypothetical protein
MSHTDNTQQNFNTNFPAWLEWKLIAKEDEQRRPQSRVNVNAQWRKEMEYAD